MFYRGREGQWSWILHRLTGVAVLLFLFAHIIDTLLLGFGPEVFNKVMAIYTHPFFRMGEIVLFAAVLYHALNGVRIIIIDFYPNATKFHRQLFYVVIALFFALMIPSTYIMIQHVLH